MTPELNQHDCGLIAGPGPIAKHLLLTAGQTRLEVRGTLQLPRRDQILGDL